MWRRFYPRRWPIRLVWLHNARRSSDELRQQKAPERATFFQQGLRDSLTASGKLKIHQDVIDRIMASYRQRS